MSVERSPSGHLWILGRSTRYLAVVRALGMLAALVLSVVLTRILGPEGFGQYALALIVIQMLSIPLGRGWGTLLMRTTARYEDEDARQQAAEILGIGRFLSAGYATMVILALFGLNWLTRADINLSLILLIGLLLLVNQNTAFRMAILRGVRYPVFAQFPELVMRPVIMVLTILVFAVWFNLPVDWYVALQALFAASVLTLFAGALLQAQVVPSLRARLAHPKIIISRGWGASALVIGTNGFIVLVYEQLDLLLLYVFSTTADLGIYKAAMQIGSYGGFAYALLSYVAAARLSAMWARNDIRKIERLAARYSRLSLVFSVLFLGVLIVLGDLIVQILFGQKFDDASMIAVFLALGHIGFALFGMSSAMLMMSNNEYFVLKGTIALLIVKFVLGMAAVFLFGTIGLALMSAISTLLLNTYLFLVVRRHLGINLSVFGARR